MVSLRVGRHPNWRKLSSTRAPWRAAGGADRRKTLIGASGVEVRTPIRNNGFELFYRFESLGFQSFAHQTQSDESNGRHNGKERVPTKYELYHQNTYSGLLRLMQNFLVQR